ncbi:MAG TPA: biotin--[acetyl-CoA-carboxylase] ligase [Myxococcota bacterium]|nr:biotin--[acetyl-CoA-carboxylase] ligase [Myxococcota bacterium]HRY91833.1 biotin--[acetyl-CoA-carboxylase] ligase [Myxococcota bacterium]HSA21907.1 biotin--[acetyl-CoA-carboxylase] ligase [Myxococcota bacterium]
MRTLDRAHLRFLEVCESTNAEARAWAEAGAPDGATVVADTQTAGRGRLGRAWCSPAGVNLYLSQVARLPAAGLRLLPLAGGLAAWEAVHAGLPDGPLPALKWPNDVRVGGLKLAGVLCEWVAGQPPAGVVGIGLNVNMQPWQFPAELRRPATSLAMLRGAPLERAACLEHLLAALDDWRARAGSAPAEVVAAFSARCETLGARVRVEPPGAPPYLALARRIDADGVLVVEDQRGALLRVEAGEVDALPAALSPERTAR